MDAAGIAERRHEERDQPRRAADLHTPLAEVDLQLPTRTRLEAHRRPSLGPQFLAQMRDRPLDRAQAHLDALLGSEFLTDHIGVAGMAAEPLFQPNLQAIQRLRARRGWWLAPRPLLQPTRSAG